jgi:sugar phosphate isomerase/epimerase
MYFGISLRNSVSFNENWTGEMIKKIKKYSDMGFKYMNFIGTSPENGAMTRNQLKEIKNAIDYYGVIPVQGTGGIPAWGSFDQAEMSKKLDAAAQFLDDAKYLGNTTTHILPPVWDFNTPMEVSWGTSLPYYKKYADMSKERGLVCSVEAIPELEYITCNFHDAIKWFEFLGKDNLYFDFNTAYFNRWRFRNEWLITYAPLFISGQLSDSESYKTGEHSDVRAYGILGSKETDLVGMIRTLIQNGIEENAKKAGSPCMFALTIDIPEHEGDYDHEIMESIKYVKNELPELKFK